MSKFLILSLFAILLTATRAQAQNGYVYQVPNQELYNTIIHMDSVYFGAYNTCDMAMQDAIYSDSIQFYHDRGGLQSSKKELLDAIKKNICGKVTRVLVKGSVEVYPIPNFGAIEIGLHQFINHQEHDALSKPDKFIIFWRFRDGKWQITQVISLH